MFKFVFLGLYLITGMTTVAQSTSVGDADVGAALEVGSGNYGAFGYETSVNLNQNFTHNFGFGIGPVGATVGLGYKIHTIQSPCYFLKNCLEQYFLRFGYSRALGTTLIETKDSVKREYKILAHDYLNLNIGEESIFFDKLIWGIYIGYRQLLSKKVKFSQQTGSYNNESEDELTKDLESQIRLALSLGYRFN